MDLARKIEMSGFDRVISKFIQDEFSDTLFKRAYCEIWKFYFGNDMGPNVTPQKIGNFDMLCWQQVL